MDPAPKCLHGAGVGVGVGNTLLRSVSLFLSGRKSSRAVDREPEAHQRRERMPRNGNRVEAVKRRTRFSWVELDNVCKLYRKLTNDNGQQQVGRSSIAAKTRPRQALEGIDRPIFRELLHNTFNILTEDTLIERMFCWWDRENDGVIRLEPWIIGLDVFLRGSIREKVEFCFKVYDLNNDGFITKDEIFILFKNCLMKQPGEEDPDEGVRDLSELALKKLDVDRDGKISFQDYKLAVKEEPLLLEAFGQCLLTEESCDSFIASLQA